MKRTAGAVLGFLLAVVLAGCSDSGPADQESARNRVVADLSQLPDVEAVGIGRDGGVTDLAITVLPGLAPDRAEELLDEGVRRVWKSDLEPLTGIRVTVTPGERSGESTLASNLRYDEDVQDVEDQLLERYGPRDADGS